MEEVFEVRLGRMLRYAGVGLLVRGARIVAWQEDGSLLWSDAAGDVRRWHPDGVGEEMVVEIERLRSCLEPLYVPQAVPAGFDALGVTAIEPQQRLLVVAVRGSTYRIDLSSYQAHPAGSDEASKRPRLVRGAFPSGPDDALEAVSPRGRFLGADDGNLYVRGENEDRVLLTDDADGDIEWSYRGDPWRPDSDVVAVVRSNFDGVARRPLTRWTTEQPQVAFVPRAEAGQPLPVRELFLLDTRTAGSRRLAVTDQDHSLRPLGWSADGGRYFFLETRRDLRSICLVAAEFGSGSLSTVLKETYQSLFSWAEIDSLVTPIRGWQRFLWRSERDGWAHLYLYDGSGHLIRQLTSGDLAVVRVVGVDEARGWAYLMGQSELRPYDTHLYRAHLEDGSQARLTTEEGQHEVRLDAASAHFVDRHSSLSRPPTTVVRRVDGAAVKHLGRADISGLVDIGWSPPDEVVVHAADGLTELHGVLFKPADFDEDGSYPLVDWIYGGPQMTWAPKSFLDPLAVTPRAMAQLGLVVLVLDSRGTPGRGKAFHDAANGSFANHVIDDHTAAIAQLAATRLWIDTNRVGIAGGSWGGYMTIRAMLTAPKTFKVGVALNAAITNREGAETIEPFLGTPHDNPAGYADADLLPLAHRLEGKLLMMAGTLDTLFGSTMRMADAFIRAGKDFDLAVLPDQPHAIGGHAAPFMLKKRARYLADHLLEP